MTGTECTAWFDEVYEPCSDRLREVGFFLTLRDGNCGAEEGGAIMDLLFGEEEEIVEGLGGGGVGEGDVDGEVGADVVVCSPSEWATVVLSLDKVCWSYELWYALIYCVGSWRVGQYERGRLHCV